MIQKRKADHLKLCAEEDVDASWNNWDDIQLLHSAIPRCDLESVDTSCVFLEKKLSAPIIISGMTGGHPMAEKVNKNIAMAAEEYGIGMGVGSQRAAIEQPKLESTYSVVKKYDIPLILANLGAPQILPSVSGYGMDEAKKAMDMVGAHVLALHLNYLQEVVQPEGETHAEGLLDSLAELCKNVSVVAKETGAGMTRDTVLSLKNAGVNGVDVGGAGGTSFAAVEVYRARAAGDMSLESLGEMLWNWGVPTPVAVLEAKESGLPMIATGGIRNGMDAVKSLALGANTAGIARILLGPAMKGAKETSDAVDVLIKELKTVMFLSGAATVEELKYIPWFSFEPGRTWLTALGHDWKYPGKR